MRALICKFWLWVEKLADKKIQKNLKKRIEILEEKLKCIN